jgi:hypothetical protein
VLTGMCSSTAENHSTGIQRTQSGGGWENKKRRRSRPTNLGLGVAEPGKAKLYTESPGTDVSGSASWLTGAVAAGEAFQKEVTLFLEHFHIGNERSGCINGA